MFLFLFISPIILILKDIVSCGINKSTVAHAEIPGLGIAWLGYVVELPRSSCRSKIWLLVTPREFMVATSSDLNTSADADIY